MGGYVGHIQYLHEDFDLTFGTLKHILRLLATGNINTVEKFDGLNLMCSWDPLTNKSMFARGIGDMREPAANTEELAKRFSKHPYVEEAFKCAFVAFDNALKQIDDRVRTNMFVNAAGHNVWYSMEVLYGPACNVIKYDHNALIMHSWPIVAIDMHNNVYESTAPGMYEFIDHFRRTCTWNKWEMCGPMHKCLRIMNCGVKLQQVCDRIDTIINTESLNDTSTIGDLIAQRLEKVLRLHPTVHFSENECRMIIERCIFGKPSLTNIKCGMSKIKGTTASTFVKYSHAFIRDVITKELAHIINDFARDLLEGHTSALIQNPLTEMTRVDVTLNWKIDTIKKMPAGLERDAALQHVEAFRKLGGLCSAALEGVVFAHAGKVYKLTGAFGSINQILGTFRYRR